MKKENLLLIISILLSILVLLFAIYMGFKSNRQDTQPPIQSNNTVEQKIEEKSLAEQEDITEEQQEEIKELLHSAWIPSWDFANGFKSLQESNELIKEANPVLYSANSDGTLLNRKPSEEELNNLLLFCKTENIQVIPTIGSYDYKITDSLFQSDIYIQKHITEIVKEIDKYDFDGIDIDYEKIRTTQKEGYIKFLTDLKTELTKKEKLLSVTVIAKTRDATEDTLFVQDWKEIGDIADRIKIMTYDFTLQTSTKPGPIGPTNWIKEVIQYAKTNIPTEKISLGIHLYAYLWKDDKASALTQTSVDKILQNTNIKREYKEDISEGYTQYVCSDNATCTLYYQTTQGIQERINIARENNLLGVSYWRLGSESNLLQSF